MPRPVPPLPGILLRTDRQQGVDPAPAATVKHSHLPPVDPMTSPTGPASVRSMALRPGHQWSSSAPSLSLVEPACHSASTRRRSPSSDQDDDGGDDLYQLPSSSNSDPPGKAGKSTKQQLPQLHLLDHGYDEATLVRCTHSVSRRQWPCTDSCCSLPGRPVSLAWRQLGQWLGLRSPNAEPTEG